MFLMIVWNLTWNYSLNFFFFKWTVYWTIIFDTSGFYIILLIIANGGKNKWAADIKKYTNEQLSSNLCICLHVYWFPEKKRVVKRILSAARNMQSILSAARNMQSILSAARNMQSCYWNVVCGFWEMFDFTCSSGRNAKPLLLKHLM